ncbi:hypothetical protein [Ponticaulis sp.]|uniref:hypothetical protein n=1 Tax=Ponticaulis sp. TaxID=2020902 RepID=UPI000C35A4DC|nr:hypothetical protein [Ponticaulis sp.]MAF59086.1 hypothetical protein [Ponticaulis sp.]MBN03054.1 hypothetical protein [Ponticaulis sp.]
MKRFLAVILSVSAVLCLTRWTLPDGTAGPPALSETQEIDFRIIELRLRRRAVIAQDVFAYGDGADLLLPLEDFFYALEFPIEVNDAEGTASGWFLRETQTFELDGASGTVTIAGETFEFRPSRLRTDGERLHVPLGLLTSWFGLNSEWNAQNQTINLEPDYLLPAEEVSMRNRRTQGSGRRAPRLDVGALSPVDAPYSWIGWPYGAADISYNLAGPDPRISDASANISLTGDFLRMTGELFASANTDGQRTARLSLSRTDASGHLFSGVLGGYGATNFRIGDVSTSTHPLLNGGGAGLGVQVSRSRLRRGGDFDTTRLEGEAFAGWQAELYRDGQLLGFLTVPSSGRYIFDEVPLTFGINRFRIELYGPLGERRTIERPVDISDAFVRRGDMEYTAEFALLGRGVFMNPRDAAQLDFDDDTIGNEGEDEDFLAGDRGQGYVAYSEMTMGLTNSLSASLGAQLRGGEGLGDHQSAFLTLAQRSGVHVLSGDFAIEDSGENALRLTYSTEFRGVSVNATAENYTDRFGQLDDENDSAQLVRRGSLRFDGRVEPFGFVNGAGWSFGFTGSERSDGAQDFAAQGRLSGQVAGVSVSQTANWRWSDSDGNGMTETANSALNVSGSVGDFRMRGSLDMSLRPEVELSRGQFEIARRVNDWFGRFRYSHDFQSESRTVGASLSRDFDGIRLGMDLRHDLEDSQTSALFTLGFNFDRHPGGRGMRFGRNARSNRGVASIRVYEDMNLDGVYTPGEDRIIPDAAVITEPRSRLISNDDRVVLDDLSTTEVIGVSVSRDELSDPYLIPATEGASFTARPAGVVSIDLPVVMSGEVEVELKDENGDPIDGRIAELNSCEPDGKRERERSAFDGYIFFQFVTPGCYTLSVPDFEPTEVHVAPGDILRPELVRLSEASAGMAE